MNKIDRLVHPMIKDIEILLKESILVKNRLLEDKESLKVLCELIAISTTSLHSGGKIIFAGNGGSFADAQHLCAEFISRFMFDRAALASIALGTNSSVISAIGNDYGYDNVFSRELEALGEENDVFIPISTSGNSKNILKAVKAAQKLKIKVIGMTGGSGGKMSELCECIKIPSNDTARIQEGHITMGHILCHIVEKKYFSKNT